MSAFLADWLGAVWLILRESGPYLLVGFVLAGLIKVFIPEDKVLRHLGKDDLRSVSLAALFGAPLPLCSCSVLPAAIALRRSGAGKGATTSFLISTPETDLESVGLTWALMDPIMTIMRPIAGILTAIGAGQIVNWMVKKGIDVAPGEKLEDAAAPADCATVCAPETDEHAGHDHAHDHGALAHAPRRENRLVGALRYAFGPLLDDITPWLVLGFATSALLTVLLPDDFFGGTVPNGWPALLLMLALSAPTYICAAASTPVAAALVAKGLDPGAEFVFLLAGPATNVATMLVVAKHLGRRVMWAYLAVIMVLALVFGWLLNQLYGLGGIEPVTAVKVATASTAGTVDVAAAVVVLALMAWSAARIRLDRRFGGWMRAACGPLGFDPTRPLAKALAVLVVLGLWLSTAVSSVYPGETGFLVRFGRVARTVNEPGPVLHLPYPIDRVVTMPRDHVRSVELGFDRVAGPPSVNGAASDVLSVEDAAPASQSRARDVDAEGEVLTGQEKLLKIAEAIHFDVRDPFRVQFGIEDPELLLRSFTEATIRGVMGNRGADESLVGKWDDLEREVGADLQEDLDRVLGKGALSVREFLLLDAHAPPQVHYAYRDVASALEDKDRESRRAEKYKREALASARAEAITIEKGADGDRELRIEQVKGEAAAFEMRAQAFRENERVSRLRLAREALERALSRVRAIVLMSPQVEPVLTQPAPGSGEGAPPPPVVPRAATRDQRSDEEE